MTDITKDLLRELHNATKDIETPKLFAEWTVDNSNAVKPDPDVKKDDHAVKPDDPTVKPDDPNAVKKDDPAVKPDDPNAKKKKTVVSKPCASCGRKYDIGDSADVRCKVCLGTEGKFLKSLREHIEMIFDKKFTSGSPLWTYDEVQHRRHSLHLYNNELKLVFDFGKKRAAVVDTCTRAQYAYIRVSSPVLTMANYNFIRDHLTSLYISDVYITCVLKRLEDLYADELTMFASERKNEVALGFTLNTETLKHLVLIGSFRYVKHK